MKKIISIAIFAFCVSKGFAQQVQSNARVTSTVINEQQSTNVIAIPDSTVKNDMGRFTKPEVTKVAPETPIESDIKPVINKSAKKPD